MDLDDVVERLDERLDTAAYADVDASPNGLQVGSSGGEVERVAVAVDAVEATAAAAVEFDADLLVAHHGIVWGGLERVTGRAYGRIAPLVENDVALYVSHLPLDGHQELGNAAGLADLLDLDDRAPFGQIGEETIGQRGRLPSPEPVGSIRDRLAESLDTGAGQVRLVDHGPEDVDQVAIVTGGGADWLDEAVEVGADLYVTGEGKHRNYHEAREAGLNVIVAGHYATETFGVRNLQALLDGWGLETTFVDHPTGI